MLDQIQQELKQAMLNKDEVKVSTLRLLISELKNTQISAGHDLSNEEILAVIQKEAKKRRESIASFRDAGREELAQKEEAELKILEIYLPAQMSDEELSKIIEETISQMGATSMADMGKIMGAVMGKTKGQADGNKVSALVKEKLTPSS